MNTQNADFKFKIFIRTIKKVEHDGDLIHPLKYNLQ